MLEILAVRATEGWTPVSVVSGLILAGVGTAALFWAIDRASRR
ncbi:MAG: hypothetical protein R3246_03260 [Acidimicrobiia bacterium]|nr:hypothetical protein [Acidimicrobiia bacterium]